MMLVLPAPEARTARYPVRGSNLAETVNWPSRFSTSTISITRPVEAHAGATANHPKSPAPQGRSRRDEHEAKRRPVAAGHLGVGVDRRRDRLGLAGNVRHEGDGGAELAQRLWRSTGHPAMMPGSANGKVTSQDQMRLAPSVAAHPSSRGPRPRSTTVWRGQQRKSITPQRARTGPAKREYDAEMICRRTDKPGGRTDQQEIAVTDRRPGTAAGARCCRPATCPERCAGERESNGDADRHATTVAQRRPTATDRTAPTRRGQLEHVVTAADSRVGSSRDAEVLALAALREAWRSPGPRPPRAGPWRRNGMAQKNNMPGPPFGLCAMPARGRRMSQFSSLASSGTEGKAAGLGRKFADFR